MQTISWNENAFGLETRGTPYASSATWYATQADAEAAAVYFTTDGSAREAIVSQHNRPLVSFERSGKTPVRREITPAMIEAAETEALEAAEQSERAAQDAAQDAAYPVPALCVSPNCGTIGAHAAADCLQAAEDFAENVSRETKRETVTRLFFAFVARRQGSLSGRPTMFEFSFVSHLLGARETDSATFGRFESNERSAARWDLHKRINERADYKARGGFYWIRGNYEGERAAAESVKLFRGMGSKAGARMYALGYCPNCYAKRVNGRCAAYCGENY